MGLVKKKMQRIKENAALIQQEITEMLTKVLDDL